MAILTGRVNYDYSSNTIITRQVWVEPWPSALNMMTLPTFTAECVCLVPAIDRYLLQMPALSSKPLWLLINRTDRRTYRHPTVPQTLLSKTIVGKKQTNHQRHYICLTDQMTFICLQIWHKSLSTLIPSNVTLADQEMLLGSFFTVNFKQTCPRHGSAGTSSWRILTSI